MNVTQLKIIEFQFQDSCAVHQHQQLESSELEQVFVKLVKHLVKLVLQLIFAVVEFVQQQEETVLNIFINVMPLNYSWFQFYLFVIFILE